MAYSRSRLRVRYEFEWRTFVARSWVGRKTAFCSNNDTLGHHASYALLCKVSGRLHFTLRRTDPLARLDGDEFASVAAGTDGTHGIAQLAERLVRMLAAVILGAEPTGLLWP